MSKQPFLPVVVFDADGVEAEEEPVRVAVEGQMRRVQVRRDQVALRNQENVLEPLYDSH